MQKHNVGQRQRVLGLVFSVAGCCYCPALRFSLACTWTSDYAVPGDILLTHFSPACKHIVSARVAYRFYTFSHSTLLPRLPSRSFPVCPTGGRGAWLELRDRGRVPIILEVSH